MRRLAHMLAAVGFVAFLSLPAVSSAFLLGEETKGVTVNAGEHSNLTIRFRLQPRLDAGDLTKSRDGTSYASESDLYLRRARLEFEGFLLKDLKYAVHFSADRWGKAGQNEEVDLFYAYLDYKFAPPLSIRAGKAKLPYSRISLTSSARQLLIERPASTEAAKKLFDDYYQPSLLVHGKFLEGVLGYALAYADGWEEGKALRSGVTVRAGGPLLTGRIELSPPGMVEKRQSDAHLGQGKHLTLGVNYAFQDSIEYRENTFDEDRRLIGLDISGHLAGLTLQAEYNQWEEAYSQPGKASKEPKGWYVQLGYFIKGLACEPVARYEEYDQDSNAQDKKEKTWAVGANWYAKGHSLKIGANWVHTEYEQKAAGRLTDDDQKDVFQLQVQLYF